MSSEARATRAALLAAGWRIDADEPECIAASSPVLRMRAMFGACRIDYAEAEGFERWSASRSYVHRVGGFGEEEVAESIALATHVRGLGLRGHPTDSVDLEEHRRSMVLTGRRGRRRA